MRRSRFGGLASLVLLVCLCCAGGIARADEPDLSELLKRVPPLDTGNDEIKSIEFEASIMTFARNVAVEYSWSRADGYSIVLRDPASRIPLLFAADGEVMQFDLQSGKLDLSSKLHPGLNAQVKEEKISVGIGAGPKQPALKIDAASFLSLTAGRGTWENRSHTVMRYTSLSPSGNTRAIADLEPARGYPLRRLEITFVEDKQTILLIEDLRVNEPLRRKLKKFPADNAFPDGLVVQRVTGPATETPEAQSESSLKMVLRLAVCTAGDNDELRKRVETFGTADWDAVSQNKKRFGPALMKMFASPNSEKPVR